MNDKYFGFMTNIRQCPRVVQDIAFEKGLISYIPADQTNESADE